MAKASIGTRLNYRRDVTSMRLSLKAATIVLMVNVLIVILVGSLFLLHFEHDYNPRVKTYNDALWLTWVTITTVGYGNNYPVTGGGKLTIVVIMVLGVGMLTTYFSVKSAKKVKDIQDKRRGLRMKITSRDHYLVLGWNDRAPFLLETLKKMLQPDRVPIVVMSEEEEQPDEDDYVLFLKGRPTTERDLLRANAPAAAAAILLAISGGESDCEGDARTVLTALSVKKLNPDIQMTAEVLEPENISHLQLAGVDEILDSNMLLGNLMARSAKHFGLITFIGELISSEPSEGLSKLPVDDKMAGMSGDELEMFLLSEKHVMPLVASSDNGFERYSKGMKLEAGGFLLVLSSTSSEGSG